MKKILAIYFLFTSYSVWSCQIEIPAFLIKINKVQDQSIFTNNNCSDEITNEFLSIISTTSGKISAKHFQNYIHETLNKSVEIKPSVFNVFDAKDFFKEKLNLTNDTIIKNISSIHSQSSLGLDQLKNIEIQCSKCSELGNQNIQVKTTKQTIWLSAELERSHKVFFAKKDLGLNFTKLSTDLFEEKIITSSKPQNYIKSLDHLNHLKLSRYLQKGDYLTRSSVIPKVLVKRGQQIAFKYLKNGIHLEGKAVAKGQGRFGQRIKIQNTKSNKYIWAVVDGENSVVIK